METVQDYLHILIFIMSWVSYDIVIFYSKKKFNISTLKICAPNVFILIFFWFKERSNWVSKGKENKLKTLNIDIKKKRKRS